MLKVHEVFGFTIVGVFAIGWLWPLGAWIVRRNPGEWYWRWVTLEQVLIGVQALIGIWLFAIDGLRASTLLHYAYGLFPILLLLAAHWVARQMVQPPKPEGQSELPVRVRPWVPFGWVAFFCFGLTLRAVMTGLGIG